MRIQGSLKSVTNGVTTLKQETQVPGFAKEQTNWQSDSRKGLVRRPPFDLVDALVNLGTDTDDIIITDVEINGQLYFFVIDEDAADYDVSGLYLYDTAGVLQTLTVTNGSYLESLTDSNSIATATINDTTFVLNKNKTVTMSSAVATSVTTSMLHITNSRQDSDAFTIKFKDGAGGAYVEITPTLPVIGEVGTNLIASTVATAITTAASNVTGYASGSTVFCITDTADYSNNEYVDLIVVEDDFTGMKAINGIVQDVSDLPASVLPDEVITIQAIEDSEAGTYYVRANALIDTIDLQPSVPPTITADINTGLIPFTEIWGATSVDWSLSTLATGLAVPPAGDIHGTVSGWLDAADSIAIRALEVHKLGVTITALLICDQHADRLFDRAVIRKSSNDAVAVNPGATWVKSDVLVDGVTRTVYEITAPSVTIAQGEDYYLDIDYTLSPDGDVIETVWNETQKTGEEYILSSTTMPLALIQTGSTFGVGEFTLGIPVDSDSNVAWASRGAGSATTSPEPDFIGRKISDIAVFQNRLMLVTGDIVQTSRGDNLFSFWRRTATQLLSTDPVSITSNASTGEAFTSINTHNRDIILFSKSGQYRIAGNVPLAPTTASLTKITSYETSDTVKPLSLGTDLAYAFPYGNSFGLARFISNENDTSSNMSFPVTDHVEGYITDDILYMTASQTAQVMFLRTSAKDEIYSYEFGQDGSKHSWSKWTLGVAHEILHIRVDHPYLYMITNDVGGLRLVRAALDHSWTDSANLGFNAHLDFKQAATIPGTSIVIDTELGDDLVMVQSGGNSDAPGDLLEYTRVGDTYTVADEDANVSITYGAPYTSDYVPQPFRVRDEGGFIQGRVRPRILSFDVHLADSGYLEAVIESDIPNFITYPEQYWTGLILGDHYTISDEEVLRDGIFTVSFKQDTRVADLRLQSSHHTGATVNQIEWIGNYTNRGRRF